VLIVRAQAIAGRCFPSPRVSWSRVFLFVARVRHIALMRVFDPDKDDDPESE